MDLNSRVLNHGGAVYGIRNVVRYGIATKSRMESVEDGMASRPKGKIQPKGLMPCPTESGFHTR